MIFFSHTYVTLLYKCNNLVHCGRGFTILLLLSSFSLIRSTDASTVHKLSVSDLLCSLW